MVKVRCSTHKRYDGVRSPRASCDRCIELYRIRLTAIAARLEIVGAKPTAKAAQAE